MTFLEWDKDAESMTTLELEERIRFIEGLNQWEAFKREFGWTGYGTLKWTLEAELKKRSK